MTNTIEWGGWTLDMIANSLNGHHIRPGEAEVVAMLLAAEGKPLQIRKMQRRMHGEMRVYPESIKIYVYRLRKKFPGIIELDNVKCCRRINSCHYKIMPC